MWNAGFNFFSSSDTVIENKLSALDNTTYCPMFALTRVLHMDDFETCYWKQTLVASKLKSKATHIEINHKVLWFGPAKCSPNDHHKYGNISFTMSTERFFGHFGFHFYFLDRAFYKSHTATRILITLDQDTIPGLEPIPLYPEEENVGTSVMRFRNDKWETVTRCRGADGPPTPHELEVGVVVTPEDCSWLYHQCTVEAVNHYRANSRTYSYYGGYESNVCHRFNTFRSYCPYKIRADDAEEKLKRNYPEY